MASPECGAGRDAATIELALLGGFELRCLDGETLALPTRKAEMLLAYLALPAGHAHSRDKLAALLWSERQDVQARGSLRNALAALRAVLGAKVIRAERDMVELAPAQISTDIDRLAAAAAGEARVDDGFLQLALRTDLLEGVVPPSETFADWLAFERTRCDGLAARAAQRAIAAHEQSGRFAEAIDLAQRLVARDPLREYSQRVLIRSYLAAGEQSRASAQLQSCRDLLERELGVAISDETVALLRAGASPRAAESHPAAAPPATGGFVDGRFSVAVLSFANLGSDPGQEFLAEGFSEDLVTEISRRREFMVIARQSSALFSGRPETASAAATELAARYALTGSLRRAGERLRVTAQLIDALGNRCIWAQRYDRAVADIFAVQDEIVSSIVASVDAEVRHDERERAARKLPRELDAWELFHRGLWHVYRFTREDVSAGEELFEQALERAPDFALPQAGLAYAAFVKAIWYFVADPKPAIAAGLAHAERAIALDGDSAFAHFAIGRLLTFSGELDRALHHLALAVELNPSFAQAHFGLAQAQIYAARPDQALASIATALRLSPKDPLASMMLTLSSFCQYSLADYVRAEADARRATQLHRRETWSRLALAAALVALGRIDDAKAVVAEARAIEPSLSLDTFSRLVASVPQELRMRVWAGLEAAGIAPRS
ncbi:MAG TPA: tetratricopeptide repeat protein [Bosea sp. (in: a-proteobacteria)]|jgi:TolB-like protein/DNA-binding SARP family transcriptional activator/Flp pilus assembly protein TadD|uniref:tetratricopeptide repeat protein n=1 Tax=Bosea sp. (in: a-proteobacteria) TaxID=1871050 RepID=UPI002E10B38F|nr:tetratricopeptide repeat protein [Bosea sp. (in: a-proteobacteria)]